MLLRYNITLLKGTPIYRIVQDPEKNDKFFIQITGKENQKRCNIPSSGFATLAKFQGIFYKGFHAFDSKEEAQEHIKTLDHTESCIPDAKQSKLKEV